MLQRAAAYSLPRPFPTPQVETPNAIKEVQAALNEVGGCHVTCRIGPSLCDPPSACIAAGFIYPRMHTVVSNCCQRRLPRDWPVQIISAADAE